MGGSNFPKVRQLADGTIDAEAVLSISIGELNVLVNKAFGEKLSEMIAAGAICDPSRCGGHGGGGEDPEECSTETRLSYQRKINLMRLGTDNYTFDSQLPLNPGQTKDWKVPAYPIGRVIENLYFRPEMADGGKPDQIRVEILGEDNVLWARFAGGRHMINACCLLEFFREDCIGWGEGFIFRLTHTGAVGQPAMVGASADWNYLFKGSQSSVKPNWCWPKRPKRRTC